MKILLIPCVVALVSCSVPPKKLVETKPKYIVHSEKLVSENNRNYGWESSKNTQDLIRDPANIKGYAIKAYVDPNNPNVRMPGGTMHVVTRPSKWNTEPLTRKGIVVEPQYADITRDVPSQLANSRLATLEREVENDSAILRSEALKSRAQNKELQRQVDSLKNHLNELTDKE